MLLAQIDAEWIRWALGIIGVSIITLLSWVWKASSRTMSMENKIEGALDVGKQAHRRISSLTPRVDQLELQRATDRATLEGLSKQLDDKTTEIRNDIGVLREDIQKALIEGARNHKTGT